MDTCDRHLGAIAMRVSCDYYCDRFVHCAMRLVPLDRLTYDRCQHLCVLLYTVGPTVVSYTSVLPFMPSIAAGNS